MVVTHESAPSPRRRGRSKSKSEQRGLTDADVAPGLASQILSAGAAASRSLEDFAARGMAAQRSVDALDALSPPGHECGPMAAEVESWSRRPDELLHVALDNVLESERNPRKRFDPAKQAELEASVRVHGLLSPLIVRRVGGSGMFEIGAGHRRSRAARAVGLPTVPVIVRDMSDEEFVELLNLENLQRADLDVLEEGDGYRQLLALPGRTVESIAAAVSKSTKYVYDRIRLLHLIPELQQHLIAGDITAGHAILLARLEPDDQHLVLGKGDGGTPWQHSGLFRFERPDGRGESLFDDDEKEAPGHGIVAVTVRELNAWINAHVRFDRSKVDVLDQPETAATLYAAQVAEEPVKVVEITYLHQVPPTARGESRTIACTSWKRADGQPDPTAHGKDAELPTRECEHSVLGVVVVGPERGEAFKVCTAKKECKVHWAKEQRERARDAKERQKWKASGERSAARKSAQDESWQEQERRREAETKAWDKAMPEIRSAVDAKLAAADTKPSGYLGLLLLGSKAQRVLVAESNTPEALVRELARGELLGDFSSLLGGSWHVRRHQAEIRKLGVDCAALVKPYLQTSAKAEKAAAKKAPAKAAAKVAKKKRRARKGAALRPLVLLLAAIALLALASCGSMDGFRRVASTLEVGAGATDHAAEDSLGNPLYSDSTAVWATIRPLAFIEPPTRVIVVQREGK